MSNRVALQELEVLLYQHLTPAPTKIYRRTQTDVFTLIDELQKGRVELPFVILTIGRTEADARLNDANADFRGRVDVYYIRPRALTTSEKGDGYTRIEDWADDFVLQVRDVLFRLWETPATVDEPYYDVTSSNPINQEFAARLPQWYALGCGTEYVVSP